MIELASKGKWKKTNTFLQRVLHKKEMSKVDFYAEKGLRALQNSTPIDTGLTALSWDYEIEMKPHYCRITWFNTNVIDNKYNIAVIVDKGHATADGAWVEGRDYIHPALADVFDDIKNLVWKEVTEE